MLIHLFINFIRTFPLISDRGRKVNVTCLSACEVSPCCGPGCDRGPAMVECTWTFWFWTGSYWFWSDDDDDDDDDDVSQTLSQQEPITINPETDRMNESCDRVWLWHPIWSFRTLNRKFKLFFLIDSTLQNKTNGLRYKVSIFQEFYSSRFKIFSVCEFFS